MKVVRKVPSSIGEYIAACSPEVRPILEKIRITIRKAAPDAIERISYGMPTFALERPLVYFGAFKKHIGFYPPIRDKSLQRETMRYQGAKGNLSFPLDEAIPYTLIAMIVKSRVKDVVKGRG